MGLLDGKVAVVTGAGGGLGRAHALALAGEGAAVVVNDVGGDRSGRGRDDGPARAVVAAIEARGGRAVANSDSVASVDGGEAIVGAAVAAFGAADILVHNAGILRDRTLHKLDEADRNAVLAVHLEGGFNVSGPFVRHARARGCGAVIVHTSSTSGLFGNFGQTAYGAAKAGLYGLVKSLALEGAKHDIRAWALVPLATTRMSEDLPPMQDAAVRRRFAPEMVSPALVYMVSDLSAGRTGRALLVGGGRIAEVRLVLGEELAVRPGYTARDVAAAADLLFAGGDAPFELFGAK